MALWQKALLDGHAGASAVGGASKPGLRRGTIAIGAKNMYGAAVNTAKVTLYGVSNRRSQRFRVEETADLRCFSRSRRG